MKTKKLSLTRVQLDVLARVRDELEVRVDCDHAPVQRDPHIGYDDWRELFSLGLLDTEAGVGGPKAHLVITDAGLDVVGPACNADLGHPCDAGGHDDSGNAIPCRECRQYDEEMYRETRREWAVASPAERDPARYRQDMIDGGRGHLLREDER